MCNLYQCPYDPACKCAMTDPCLGCETFHPKERVEDIAAYRTTIKHLLTEVQSLKKALRESEDRGSALSASACVHPRGIVGDERGHAVCPLRSVCGELAKACRAFVDDVKISNGLGEYPLALDDYDAYEKAKDALARYRVMGWCEDDN